MILSQIKIFNFFLGLLQPSSIISILSSFCDRYGHNYIPQRGLWITWLYFEISNSTQKQCLTVDTRDVNDLGSAKFRTQTDNNKEKICYHNRNKRDTSFSDFLAVRKQTSSTSEIIVSIDKVIDRKNGNNNIYFKVDDELSDFKNDNV